MNRIIYAGHYSDGECIYNKTFELVLPDGAGKILSDKQETPFSAGTAIIIPPLYKCAIFGSGALRITFGKAILPFKKLIIIPDDENGGIAHAAKQAEKYFHSDLAKKDLILCATGGLLVSYAVALSVNSKFSPAVDLVRAEITKRVSDCTFSLEDCLAKMPLNSDYIRKLFKKEVGLTPHAYLLRERMELARSILSSGISNQYSAYTVSQVAESCGFSEPLYFSRVFKKYFGVSPSEYK